MGSGDGVATQQQEVVVCRYRLDLEDVAPHPGDARLQLIAGGVRGNGLAHLVVAQRETEARQPFDLTRGPLLRATLARLDDEHISCG